VLGASVDSKDDHKTVVVESCEQLHGKLKAQQLQEDKVFVATHEQCFANVESLSTVKLKFEKSRAESEAGIEQTSSRIEAKIGEVNKGHGRIGTIEKEITKQDSNRLEALASFEKREAARNSFIDSIKVELAKLCLLSDYKGSSSCAVSKLGQSSASHVRFTDGKYGNKAADSQCVIPFTYKGKEHADCVGTGYGGEGWCSTDSTYAGNWGSCHLKF
jgi:hypothetical protein